MRSHNKIRVLIAFLMVISASQILFRLPASADAEVEQTELNFTPYGIAIDPDGLFAYVSSSDSGNLMKIDLSSNLVVSKIILDDASSATNMVIDPTGTFAYLIVPSYGIYKISLTTNLVVQKFPLAGAQYGVALNPVDGYLYVTDFGNGILKKVNPITGTVVDSITVGNYGIVVKIDPLGEFAYVTNYYETKKISLQTKNVVATYTTGYGSAALAIDSAGHYGYVTNNYNDTVIKIDLRFGGVLGTVSVGDSPNSIKISPTATFAYTTNQGSETVSKIDLSSFAVVETIKVGNSPINMDINPAGSLAFVLNNQSRSFSKIDFNAAPGFQRIIFSTPHSQTRSTEILNLEATSTSGLDVEFTSASESICSVVGSAVTLHSIGKCVIHADQPGGLSWLKATRVTRTFDVYYSDNVTLGESPRDIAIDPDVSNAYVTNYLSNTVSKIDLDSYSVVRTIQVGDRPTRIATNPLGGFAYVANSRANTISKIDLSTDQVTSSIIVSSMPGPIAVHPSGNVLYLGRILPSKISVLDLLSETVSTNVTLDDYPTGIVMDPPGTAAYVVSSTSIKKIDVSRNTVTAEFSISDNPTAIAIETSGRYAYVTNGFLNTVSKIDLTDFTEVGSVRVGEYPNSIAIDSSGQIAFVISGFDSTLSKIDLTTFANIETIDLDFVPNKIILDSKRNFGYITSESSNSVMRIALNSGPFSQSISFQSPGTLLSNTGTTVLNASASSGLAVTFTSTTPSVCTVTGAMATIHSSGQCSIQADQIGSDLWFPAARVSRTFSVLPSPPTGVQGFSILDGASFTNSKSVQLNLVWPEYATEVLISNDGGFAASRTKTMTLSELVDWDLDDSVKGAFTKVVYVRFNGAGIDTTKTYSDDIILDTTAPIIESSSGSVSGSDSLSINLKVSDDITGVDEVQVAGGSGSVVTRKYAPSLNISLADLDLTRTITSFGSEGRRIALASTGVRVRVSDVAGNWSSWTLIPVSGVTSVGRFGTTSPSKVSVKRVKIAGATTFDNQTTGLPQTGIGAVALNVTAVEGYDDKGYGFVTTYPCDTPSTPAPNSSNLNFSGGQTIPNAVIAPVSADGYICFGVTGNTDLLVDASGYFPTGPGFTSLTEPKRLIDTRSS